MMQVTKSVRSLDMGKKVVTIKLNTNGLRKDQQDIEALFALLGGYNTHARGVNLDYYHKLQEKVQNAIDDMAYAIYLAKESEQKQNA